ncbi:hypothetical protein PQX77_003877 [Marasmius sp. AFHP31]|nr:hypothetical protein PQX77_003877 [Marasmius sp. AFHP31]
MSSINERDLAQHTFYPDENAVKNQQAGVVEARPGIIESSNIDPLNENSNKDDGWANAKSTTSDESLTSKAANIASDATTKTKEMFTGSK